MKLNRVHVNIIFIVNLLISATGLISLIALTVFLLYSGNALQSIEEMLTGSSTTDYDGLQLIFGSFSYIFGLFLYAVAIAVMIVLLIYLLISFTLNIVARCLVRKETRGKRIAYRILMGVLITAQAYSVLTAVTSMLNEFRIWEPFAILTGLGFVVYEILMVYTKLGMKEVALDEDH